MKESKDPYPEDNWEDYWGKRGAKEVSGGQTPQPGNLHSGFWYSNSQKVGSIKKSGDGRIVFNNNNWLVR